MRGQLSGTLMGGCFVRRFASFAFFVMKRIRKPVRPVEITPAIPRIVENPRSWNFSIMMKRRRGSRDVNTNVFFFENLKSKRKVSLSAKESTKYEVSIVKIPRTVTIGPNERVATSVTFCPSTPTKVAVKMI